MKIQSVASSSSAEAARLRCQFFARCRRPRLYLVGSPADMQHAVLCRKAVADDRLHLLHDVKPIEWSRIVQIPENGILIQPDSGDVLRYWHRDR